MAIQWLRPLSRADDHDRSQTPSHPQPQSHHPPAYSTTHTHHLSQVPAPTQPTEPGFRHHTLGHGTAGHRRTESWLDFSAPVPHVRHGRLDPSQSLSSTRPTLGTQDAHQTVNPAPPPVGKLGKTPSFLRTITHARSISALRRWKDPTAPPPLPTTHTPNPKIKTKSKKNGTKLHPVPSAPFALSPGSQPPIDDFAAHPTLHHAEVYRRPSSRLRKHIRPAKSAANLDSATDDARMDENEARANENEARAVVESYHLSLRGKRRQATAAPPVPRLVLTPSREENRAVRSNAPSPEKRDWFSRSTPTTTHKGSTMSSPTQPASRPDSAGAQRGEPGLRQLVESVIRTAGTPSPERRRWSQIVDSPPRSIQGAPPIRHMSSPPRQQGHHTALGHPNHQQGTKQHPHPVPLPLPFRKREQRTPYPRDLSMLHEARDGGEDEDEDEEGDGDGDDEGRDEGETGDRDSYYPENPGRGSTDSGIDVFGQIFSRRSHDRTPSSYAARAHKDGDEIDSVDIEEDGRITLYSRNQLSRSARSRFSDEFEAMISRPSTGPPVPVGHESVHHEEEDYPSIPSFRTVPSTSTRAAPPPPPPTSTRPESRQTQTATPVDPTQSAHPVHSVTPTESRPPSRPDDGRRSSSPFEVKFTPTITKRISLDAFGGAAGEGKVGEWEVEELAECDDLVESANRLDEGSGEGEEEMGEREQQEIGVGRRVEGQLETVLEMSTELSADMSNLDQESATSGNKNREMDVSVAESATMPTTLDTPQTKTTSTATQTEPRNEPIDTNAITDEATKAELEGKVERLKARLEVEVARGVMSESEEVWRLKEENKVLVTDLDTARQSILVLTEAKEKLDKEKKAIITQLEKARDEAVDDALSRAKVHEELRKSEEDRREMELGRNALNGRVEGLQVKVDEAEKRRDEVEAQARTTVAELESVRVELAALKDRNIDLINAHGDLQTSYEELQTTHAAIMTRLEIAETTCLSQATTIESQTTTIETLKSSVKEHESKSVTQDALVAQLREKLGLARFAIDEARVGAEAKVDEAERRVEEKEREVEERKMVSDAMRERVAVLEEERRGWEEEKTELLEALSDQRGNFEYISALQRQLEDQTTLLASVQDRTHFLESTTDEHRLTLQSKNATIDAQRAELENLRVLLSSTEDKLASTLSDAKRQAKDAERATEHLYEQLEEARGVVEGMKGEMEAAVGARELALLERKDTMSRLEAYLVEIERLKVVEFQAKQRREEDAKRSANEELEKVRLGRLVKALEEEKELLNAALESKTLEVVLLQRERGRSGAGTGTGTGKGSGTGRTLMTPTPTTPTRRGKSPAPTSTPTPTPTRGAKSPMPSTRVGLVTPSGTRVMSPTKRVAATMTTTSTAATTATSVSIATFGSGDQSDEAESGRSDRIGTTDGASVKAKRRESGFVTPTAVVAPRGRSGSMSVSKSVAPVPLGLSTRHNLARPTTSSTTPPTSTSTSISISSTGEKFDKNTDELVTPGPGPRLSASAQFLSLSQRARHARRESQVHVPLDNSGVAGVVSTAGKVVDIGEVEGGSGGEVWSGVREGEGGGIGGRGGGGHVGTLSLDGKDKLASSPLKNSSVGAGGAGGASDKRSKIPGPPSSTRRVVVRHTSSLPTLRGEVMSEGREGREKVMPAVLEAEGD